MQKNKIKELFLNAWEEVWNRTDLNSVLQYCTEQEAVYMKYLYTGMPYSDMADYSAELFLKFVRHALMVRQCTPWGNSVDEITFLNYIMQYRVNNEHIEFYSELFFEQIYPRIQNLSMYEAAVEVNFWAYEQATYHSTDDRTASPFTVIKNAYGRCGEESTLVTAALRSVGIPARQVYAPRWSHCDDNHAWVEVWIDGNWHFLGACEPEVKLDRGWFVLASSRAPIVHTRAFSRIIEKELDVPVICQNRTTRINVLSHYADTKTIYVTVLDPNGDPKPDVTVQFEIVNYSELYPIAELKTDQDGKAEFVTAKGSIVVSAFDKTGYGWKVVDVREDDEVIISLCNIGLHSKRESLYRLEQEEECSFTLVPAVGGEKQEEQLTEEEKEEQQIRILQSENIRHQTEDRFYTEEKANAYARSYIKRYGKYIEAYEKNNRNIEKSSLPDFVQDGNCSLEINDLGKNCEKEVQLAIYNSRGNEEEIRRFLEDNDGKEQSFYKCKLLSSIRKKDLSDTSSEVLMNHLKEALRWTGKYSDDIFIPYVLCPRIWDERIVSYRSSLRELFSKEQIQEIQKDPRQIGRWIEKHINCYKDSSYAELYTSPVGAIRLGMASERSIQILAVAMLRSIGIAGKIDLSSCHAVYWDGTEWRFVFSEKVQKRMGSLHLLSKDGENLQYFTNVTIARWDENHYKTLNLSEVIWKDGRGIYELEEGKYRIITTERQLGGICQVKLFFVIVKKDCVIEKVIDCLKELAIQKRVTVENAILQKRDGEITSLKQWLNQKEGITAWIEVGKEPTEHLLNEIMAAKEKYKKIQALLIVSSEESFSNTTLIQTMKEVPSLHVLIQQSSPDSNIYEQFQLPKKALPLVVVFDQEGNAVNACAGYNVGTGELVLNALKG